MGVIRAEPARISDWAAKSVGAAWRFYDLQLTTYAGLLVAIGLVMAYTNSLEGGGIDLQPRPDVGGHRRRRVHRRDGLRLPLAQDPGLAHLRHPDRSAGRDPGGRRWRRRIRALDLDRSARFPVQRDRQDPHDHRACQLPVGARGAPRLAVPDHRCLPAGGSRRLLLVMLQPDLGTSLVFGAILAGMLWMSGASLRWLTALAVAVSRWSRSRGRTCCATTRRPASCDFLDANPDIQGAGFQLHQAQIAVGSGGFFGKGLTNGTQTQGDLLPVQATDFVFATLSEELGFIGAVVLFTLVRAASVARARRQAGGRATRSARCSRAGSRR